jgi:nucleoside-diphosphate-sugar epimerase
VIRHVVDIRDTESLRRLVLGLRPSIIYNLASHGAYPHQTDAKRIIETNACGLTALLSAADEVDYRLLVHTGSSSEYGRKTTPMREADVLAPESVYGVSKAAQSLLCQQWARAKRRPIVVFRLFSVYGPFEERTRLLPRLLTAHLDDHPLALVSPETSRDFVYVDDVVEALLKVEELSGLSGTILNLGTGVQTRLADLVTTLESLTARKFRAEWNTMPPRPWDTNTWVADTTLLRERLGWLPKTTVRDGLNRSLEWMRANRRYYPANVSAIR